MTTSAYEQGFMDAFTAYAVKCASIQSTKLVPSKQNSTDPSKVNEGVIPGTTPPPKFAQGRPQFGTAGLQVGKTKQAGTMPMPPGATPAAAPNAPVAPPKSPTNPYAAVPRSGERFKTVDPNTYQRPSPTTPQANTNQGYSDNNGVIGGRGMTPGLQNKMDAAKTQSPTAPPAKPIQTPTAPPAKPIQTPIQAAAPKAPAGSTGGISFAAQRASANSQPQMSARPSWAASGNLGGGPKGGTAKPLSVGGGLTGGSRVKGL